MRNSQLLFEKASRLARSGARHLKAEFEAEGSRREEVASLRASTRQANLGLTLKIGGCEAITDLRDAIEGQAEVIVAPMVESPYAVEKFDLAITHHHEIVSEGTEFLVNLETVSAFSRAEEILDKVASSRNVSGVVFGRVDFVKSQGLDRDSVDSAECLAAVLRVAELARARNLLVVVGGAVSDSSEEFLKEVARVHLSRFETRKVVYDAEILSNQKFSELIRAALDFELSWLRSKNEYYGAIAGEDLSRIAMLETRLAKI